MKLFFLSKKKKIDLRVYELNLPIFLAHFRSIINSSALTFCFYKKLSILLLVLDDWYRIFIFLEYVCIHTHTHYRVKFALSSFWCGACE